MTAAVPEVVEAALALPARELILDGEAIALRARRRAAPVPGHHAPLRPQARRRGAARRAAAVAVLLRLPVARRRASCSTAPQARARRGARRARCRRRCASSAWSPPTATPPRRSCAARSPRGHEGVMAKALGAPYEAGSRGASWLKVKQAQTLDLVVLAAEWGSGRRQGWLSNLHLGARDPRRRLRHARQDLQGAHRRDARVADRAAAGARRRGARGTSSTCAPSWWWRSPSTTCRRARTTPAGSPCASRASSATARQARRRRRHHRHRARGVHRAATGAVAARR